MPLPHWSQGREKKLGSRRGWMPLRLKVVIIIMACLIIAVITIAETEKRLGQVIMHYLPVSKLPKTMPKFDCAIHVIRVSKTASIMFGKFFVDPSE